MFKTAECFRLNIQIGSKIFLRNALEKIGIGAEKSYKTFLGTVQNAFEIPVFFLKEKIGDDESAESLPFFIPQHKVSQCFPAE